MLADIQPSLQELLDKAGGIWGIVIEDLTTGEQLVWNEQRPFYAASLIKVPIMAAVFAEVYNGNRSFADTCLLRQEDLVGGAGVLQHMTPGTAFTLWDLTTLMIIQSDNTATNILIDLLGKERIRQMIQQLGMTNSQFHHKLMIVPAKAEGSNEVSAAGMAALFRQLSKGQILSYHSCQQMIAILKKQQLRDCLPYYLPEPDHPVIGGLPLWELANKTGMVRHIQHDVGILYLGQHAILIAMLSQNVEARLARETIGRTGKLLFDHYRQS
ncbi:serine hydrolase [Brevibacillus fulvus]|uniref:Beta-lactamase class A n=1 Tax=Brevibacillus fulvus TaxID=1125967 RepID=A0A938XXE1_9BACL|nr:serine hydrolase [Brevibacillus fulvus]MBM7589914.1 beta-lactamase class A [Brevibacillus fulvus]